MKPGDAVYIGSGFGAVLTVNAARGIALVLFQSGAMFDVPLSLAMNGARALAEYEATLN